MEIATRETNRCKQHRPPPSRLRACLRALRRDESGAALVEFALVVPVLLLLLFGMIDFGKAYNYWIDETHVAAGGARYAVVNKWPTSGTQSLQAYIKDQLDTGELKSGGTGSVPSAAQVCISFPSGTQKIGDPVKVSVSTDYHFMNFIFNSALTKTVTGSSTMRLEAPPSYASGCA